MSCGLIPTLLGVELWDDRERQTRFFDPNLGLLEKDLLTPRVYHQYVIRPRQRGIRQVSSPGLSEVASTADKFQVSVDVSHFNPEDISVKTVDNYLVVRAKHEERADEHGFISREFTRRYMLPKDAEPESVVSSLSSDGVLTVVAPKVKGQLASNERVIPISRKETPSLTNEDKA